MPRYVVLVTQVREGEVVLVVDEPSPGATFTLADAEAQVRALGHGAVDDWTYDDIQVVSVTKEDPGA